MPEGPPSESVLFAQLAYYSVNVPVTPLPRGLNEEAKKIGANFILEAGRAHQRFLALAFRPSYPTLDWLAGAAREGYSARKLGTFDDIAVVEFRPRISAGK